MIENVDFVWKNSTFWEKSTSWEKFIPWENRLYSTGMYIINRKGINNIFHILNNCNKFLELNKMNFVADEVIYNRLTYTYTKPLVNHSINNNSTINHNHDNVEKSAHYIIKNYFENDIKDFLSQFLNKKVILILNPGNGGDALIASATFKVFDELKLNYVI